MTYDFLLLGLVRSGLLLGFALLLMWAFRMRPAVQRVIGRSALVLGAGLFLVQPQLDYSRTTYTPYSSTYVSVRPVVTVAAPKFGKPVPQSNFEPTERVIKATEANFELRALDLWAIGTCALLLWTLLGSLKIRRILRRGAPLTPEGSLRIVSEPSVSTPFVAGLFRPTLFIPSDWEATTSPDEREFVLQHERAHLANRDLPWLYLSRLMIALCWPNPLFWLVAARLRAVSETLSDESVLAAGADPRAYAACLLNHHQRARKHAPSVAFSTVGRKSSLSQRIEAILASRRANGLQLSGRTRLMILCSVLLVGGLAAVVFGKPQSTSTEPQKYDGWYLAGYDTEVEVNSRDGSTIKDAWIAFRGMDRRASVIAEALSHDSTRVFVKGAGRVEQVAGLWVLMSNGDLAFSSLWPRDEVLRKVTVRPAKTVPIHLTGVPVPAGGIKVGIDTLFVSALGEEQGQAGIVPEQLRSRFEVTTSDSGYAQLVGLPVNTTAFLSIRDSRFTVADQKRQIAVARARTEAEEIRILPASAISGRATFNGKGLGGVSIVAQIQKGSESEYTCSWGQTVSDAEGKYSIPQLAKGTYNVTAILSPEQQQKLAVRAAEGVSLPMAANVTGIDLALEPVTNISGAVHDEHGLPLSGVYIGVYGPSRPESSAMIEWAVTDKRGVYSLNVPSGKHRVYISDSRWEMTSKEVETAQGKPAVADFVTKGRQQEEVRVGRQPTEDELKEMKDRERVEAAEREPTPAAMSFGPGGPFYGPIKLKSGVTIKLEFMQCIVDGRDRIWQPDGSAPTGAQKKISLPLGFKPESGDVRRMLGYISFDKKLGEFPTAIVQVPQPSSWNVYQSYGVQNDNRSINMASFRANKTLRQTDMKFGVATGPWKVIGGITFGMNGTIKSDELFITHISSSDNSRTVHVWLRKKWSDFDLQMRAYSASGKEYAMTTYSPPEPDTKSGQLKASFTFEGSFGSTLDPKKFSKLELIARPYEWVTFKGIHLYPN